MVTLAVKCSICKIEETIHFLLFLIYAVFAFIPKTSFKSAAAVSEPSRITIPQMTLFTSGIWPRNTSASTMDQAEYVISRAMPLAAPSVLMAL